MSLRRAIVIVLTTLGATGCATVTVRAPVTINPVMLGPVMSIGADPNGPHPKSDRVAIFRLRLADSSIAGSDAMGGSTARSYRSAVQETDLQVVRLTNGDPNRRVALDSLGCGSYFVFGILVFESKTWCDVRGEVLDGPEMAVPPKSKQPFDDGHRGEDK